MTPLKKFSVDFDQLLCSLEQGLGLGLGLDNDNMWMDKR